jgi:hypothetical protein
MIERIAGRFLQQHMDLQRTLRGAGESAEFESLLRRARERAERAGHAGKAAPAGSGAAGSAGKGPEDGKLLDACYQMEALFLGTMLDAMRRTVQESEFFGKSMAKDIFRDMLYDEYANLMARTDRIGLARRIYDQLGDS